jgi:hypothetical protein
VEYNFPQALYSVHLLPLALFKVLLLLDRLAEAFPETTLLGTTRLSRKPHMTWLYQKRIVDISLHKLIDMLP